MCPKSGKNKLFVHMGHFWDLLFQLMKHGTNTLHVAFIFFIKYSGAKKVFSQPPIVQVLPLKNLSLNLNLIFIIGTLQL